MTPRHVDTNGFYSSCSRATESLIFLRCCTNLKTPYEKNEGERRGVAMPLRIILNCGHKKKKLWGKEYCLALVFGHYAALWISSLATLEPIVRVSGAKLLIFPRGGDSSCQKTRFFPCDHRDIPTQIQSPPAPSLCSYSCNFIVFHHHKVHGV